MRKCEAILSSTLRLSERVACEKTIRSRVNAVIRRVDEITNLVCVVERAVQKFAASSNMFGHRKNDVSEMHAGSGLEPLQSASFDQIVAEPPKSVCSLIVAKARACVHAQPHVGRA
jgi:hypothetical protein